MKNLTVLFLLVAILNCKSNTKSTIPYSEMSVPQEKSLLYVYRLDAAGGQNKAFTVEIDGQRVGFLKIGAFFVEEILPGMHAISINETMQTDYSSIGAIASTAGLRQKIQFEVPKGAACYVRIVGIQMQNVGCDKAPSDIKNAKLDKSDQPLFPF